MDISVNGKAFSGNLSVTVNGKATNTPVSLAAGQASSVVTVSNNGLSPITSKKSFISNMRYTY
jgi:hypothetical protein